MGRLVDVDELMRIANSEFSENDLFKINWLISHTPTAYDVDEVLIKQLEEGCFKVDELLDDSIDIVRKGGV